MDRTAVAKQLVKLAKELVSATKLKWEAAAKGAVSPFTDQVVKLLKVPAKDIQKKRVNETTDVIYTPKADLHIYYHTADWEGGREENPISAVVDTDNGSKPFRHPEAKAIAKYMNNPVPK